MPPTGFKRSRSLWDNARRLQESRWEQFLAYLCAILYELQPIRFSQVDTIRWKRQVTKLSQRTRVACRSIPSWARRGSDWAGSVSARHWLMAVGILMYYWMVRLIHKWLDAGPFVVILTALGAIFTVGLGDDVNRDGFSAYAAFNRGFQRILGTIDADAVLAQHVGGGWGGAIEHFEDDNHVLPPRPNLQRPMVARRVADHHNDDDNNNEVDDDGLQPQPHPQPNNNRARKSGKKARRRNLEQRREIQRQREAAIAMGFGPEGGEEGDDLLAQHFLLGEAIAAANNQ